MSTRRALGLLAVVALLAPSAALGAVDCVPGPHCPMAGVLGDGPPCHGTAMQADDCCPEMVAAAPADAPPVTAVSVFEVATSAPAVPATADRVAIGAARCGGPSTPLYRLFRALLI